uniref:Uncharacterized protein n=1 Tax=Setaria italica TaxID=4555 RepID=K3XP43_SETIT
MAPHQAISAHCPSSTSNMSDKCGNCDCADRSQCTKGNSYGVVIADTERYVLLPLILPLRAP